MNKGWKKIIAIIALIAVVVAGDIINRRNNGTAASQKDADVVDYAAIDKFMTDSGFDIGTQDDNDQALQFAEQIKSKYNDQLRRSPGLLYMDLITPRHGNFTPSAAKYAVENCDYDWNQNALYWANYYSLFGLSDDAIKSELTLLQRGGGFTANQAAYGAKHKTFKDDGNTYNIEIEGIDLDDSARAQANNDTDSAKKMLDKLLDGQGYSYTEIKYMMKTYGGYSDDVVGSLISGDSSVDWSVQALKIAYRLRKEGADDDAIGNTMVFIHEFESKYAKYALKHV